MDRSLLKKDPLTGRPLCPKCNTAEGVHGGCKCGLMAAAIPQASRPCQYYVYLGGPIFGMMDNDCKSWRKYSRAFLGQFGIGVIDPMERDYRQLCPNTGPLIQEVIVEPDLRDLGRADALLVNAVVPSWGTAMEVYHYWTICRRKTVVAVVPPGVVSPWLVAHTLVRETTMVAALQSMVMLLQGNNSR